MEWNDAVHAFWHANSAQPWLSVEPTGNCSISALVEFKASVRSTSTISRATIVRNGYDEGTILLAATSDMSVDEFHTSFKPIGQARCRYRKQINGLLISGSSPKMGTYEVAIIPRGRDAV